MHYAMHACTHIFFVAQHMFVFTHGHTHIKVHLAAAKGTTEDLVRLQVQGHDVIGVPNDKWSGKDGRHLQR